MVRKGYDTTDHIFNLERLIDLYLFRGKNYIVSEGFRFVFKKVM